MFNQKQGITESTTTLWGWLHGQLDTVGLYQKDKLNFQ